MAVWRYHAQPLASPSPSLRQLIIASGAQGIGAALLVPGSLAVISANFSKENRGRAIGTWAAFTSIAAGLGSILGGWLVEALSWRWIFFLNLPLAALILVVAWWRVPESRSERATGGIDWLGAMLATAGLFGLDSSASKYSRSSRVPFLIAAARPRPGTTGRSAPPRRRR